MNSCKFVSKIELTEKFGEKNLNWCSKKKIWLNWLSAKGNMSSSAIQTIYTFMYTLPSVSGQSLKCRTIAQTRHIISSKLWLIKNSWCSLHLFVTKKNNSTNFIGKNKIFSFQSFSKFFVIIFDCKQSTE